MLTLNDIVNVSFRKANFSGYRSEDVDSFIDQVKESYEELIQKSIKLKETLEQRDGEIQQLTKKMEILATKVEDYRNEEDGIKNALVSAQKLGDASVRESRHKAEIIIKDATMKAERIVSGAQNEIVEQQQELDRLKQAVSEFRTQLLNTYKEHLTLINALPGRNSKPAAPRAAEKVPAAAPAQPSNFTEEAAPQQKPAPQEEAVHYQVQVSNFDDDTEEATGDTVSFSPLRQPENTVVPQGFDEP